MNKLIEFQYAYGTIEQLKEGKFDSMPVAESLTQLELSFENKGVFIPRFVGVYQNFNFGIDGRELDDNRNKQISGFIRMMDDAFCQPFFEARFGCTDRSYHSLIHVGSEDGLERHITKGLFQDSMGRVAFSEISNLPDFRNKKTFLVDDILPHPKGWGF